MRKMGIEAKPRLSKPHPDIRYIPGRDITEDNFVWCLDITYIPMAKGIIL